MARVPTVLAAGMAFGLVAMTMAGVAFVHGPASNTNAPGMAPSEASPRFLSAVPEDLPAAEQARSWASSLLSAGAVLGLALGLLAAQPAGAITKEQFDQLTYAQVKGSGLANRCPTVENQGTSIKVKAGDRLRYVCFEPKSFAIEAETEPGKKEFVTTKLMTRQTYTLAFIDGPLSANPITFKVEDGMDHAPTTVQLPDGERVPFLFTVKGLQVKGQGGEFKPGFTWGGEFEVPSYRTGGFLDPKGRGMYLGYDQAVALPALQADGKGGQDELFKESNKVFDIGKGAMEMEVNKVNAELGEIGGVFVSKQPSDTDMGAKAPKTVLMKGIFFGKVE